jgi:ATP-dependent helicase/nuclease subunit B
MHREEIGSLAPDPSPARARLVSEAMRPAATSESWRNAAGAQAAGTIAGVAVIESANADEEALAIAIALREAVDTPGHRAALVTPDRALARRVAVALERWHVEVDDSSGEPLADTPAGVFASLAADAALRGLEPVTLLALVKHPRTELGIRARERNMATSALERALLRGPRPRAGTAGLASALATFRENRDDLHQRDPRRRIADYELNAAEHLSNASAQRSRRSSGWRDASALSPNLRRCIGMF